MVRAGERASMRVFFLFYVHVHARIIVDMSYPHLHGKPNVFGSVPLSCNSGIDAKSFPAEMSSTRDVVEILLRQGPGATFCKQVSKHVTRVVKARP